MKPKFKVGDKVLFKKPRSKDDQQTYDIIKGITDNDYIIDEYGPGYLSKDKYIRISIENDYMELSPESKVINAFNKDLEELLKND